MNEILPAGPIGFAAIQLFAKVALVVGIAAGICLALRRSSAGVRHLVWTGAVVALLVLPVLTVLLPAWEVKVIPSMERFAAAPGFSPAGTEGVDAAGVSGQPTEGSAGISVGTRPIDPIESRGESIDAVRARITGAPAATAGASLDWQLWLVIGWMAGTILLLARIFLGWWGLRGFARDAQPVTNPEWLQLLKDARWMLGVERPVRLLQSGTASMPVTWGTLKPAVLLPESASQWSEERLRMVLLHEVAHVSRYDCFTQMLASIGCALYWFHPLSWVAARRLRVERERACDDLVLAAGERASEYASHLLEVARTFRPAAPVGIAAIAMARPSQLEGRLLAVLDAARARQLPGRRFRVAGLAAMVLLLMPLAAAQAVGVRESTQAAQDGTEAPSGEPQLSSGEESSRLAVEATGSLPASTAASAPPRHPVLSANAADSVVELRIAANPGETVSLDLSSGGRVEIVGWDRNEISVQGQLSGSRVRDMTVELERTADGVRLVSRFRGQGNNRNGDIRFHVLVPNRSDVAVRSAGGDVAISSVAGRLSGLTGGGSLKLVQVAGQADLTTGGGNVEVTDAVLDGTITTGGGNIRVSRVAGGLQARTGGGDISIADEVVPARGSAPSQTLRYTTGGGNIEVGGSAYPLDVTTGGGSIRVGTVRAELRAQTGGGSIRIAEAGRGVTATTGSGEVRIGQARGPIEVNSGAGAVEIAVASGGPYEDIDIRTGNGSVTLTLPADFAGRFDIGAGSRRRNGIVSDFPLAIDGDGRGTGQVGSGANVVRIRTNDGAVTIRRAGATVAVNVSASAATSPSNMNINENVQVNVPVVVRTKQDIDLEVEAAIEHALGLADHTSGDPEALEDFLRELGSFTATQTMMGLETGFRAAAEALRLIGTESRP